MIVFLSSRRRHTRLQGDWSSDVCSSDLARSPLTAETSPGDRGRASYHGGHSFEHRVADAYRLLGYDVEVRRGFGGREIDQIGRGWGRGRGEISGGGGSLKKKR